jgi:hypothetical protein
MIAGVLLEIDKEGFTLFSWKQQEGITLELAKYCLFLSWFLLG